METILSLKDVSAFYDGKPALERVTMEIPSHQITAILGPSGCGKSTLLRCINGLLEEEHGAKMSGSIFLEGMDIHTLPKETLRRRVGLVFQTPSPFPFSIYRNMTYAPRYYGMRDKKKLDALVREKLEMAGLYAEIKDDLGKSARKLSGGQQQRLCIARALTVEPDVLLLDEPCSALDVRSTAVLEATLTELKKNYTIIVVTHNIAQARRLADYAAFLYNGHLAECGPSETLFSNPQQEQTRAFLSGIYG